MLSPSVRGIKGEENTLKFLYINLSVRNYAFSKTAFELKK
jgi:hypothetical protein